MRVMQFHIPTGMITADLDNLTPAQEKLLNENGMKTDRANLDEVWRMSHPQEAKIE